MIFSKKTTDPTIEKVCEKTGWHSKKAEKQMDAAKELGLSYKLYLKHEAWNLSEEEIKALVGRLQRQKESRERAIKTICERTGCAPETAAEGLNCAAACGITRKQYLKKCGWDLSPEELPQLAEALAKAEELRLQRSSFYIDAVCRKSGWDRPKAEAEMNRFLEMGITYLKYAQSSFWEMDAETEQKAVQEILAYKDTISDNKESYRREIMEKTGWSRGKTELEVLKCKNICGASYEDFLVFKLYECTPQQQREYVTLDMFIRMRLTYNDHMEAKRNFDNKAVFNEKFSPYIHRRWFVNTDLSWEDFCRRTDGISDFLVKPIAATQGKGIYKLHLSADEKEKRAAYESLTQENTAIIEEYIHQHESVAAFCPSSVNTLRITTLYLDGKCHFLYAVFRMGQGSVVDNFHAGGIAASVDTKTGIVITDAADLAANTYPVHPTSGLTIKGFRIPHWDQILATCEEIAPIIAKTHLVGWDFAITPDGVDLIEGNPGASYVVAQMPHVAERKGLRKTLIDPYLTLPY